MNSFKLFLSITKKKTLQLDSSKLNPIKNPSALKTNCLFNLTDYLMLSLWNLKCIMRTSDHSRQAVKDSENVNRNNKTLFLHNFLLKKKNLGNF